jgi:hypothetical protein
MFFLFRVAFWLALVILFLPGDPETGEPAPRVSAMEAFSAAGTVVSDLSSFCERNPDVCATGSSALTVLTQKVMYGAELLRDYLTPAADDPAGTLGPEDQRPGWRGPPEGI